MRLLGSPLWNKSERGIEVSSCRKVRGTMGISTDSGSRDRGEGSACPVAVEYPITFFHEHLRRRGPLRMGFPRQSTGDTSLSLLVTTLWNGLSLARLFLPGAM